MMGDNEDNGGEDDDGKDEDDEVFQELQDTVLSHKINHLSNK